MWSVVCVVVAVAVVVVMVCVVWSGTLKTPVSRFKTSPCVPAPRAHVETHVRVVPVHTVSVLNQDTEGVLNVHTLTLSQHTHTHQTQHQRNITRRQTERETEKEREREREKMKEEREETTRGKRKREKKKNQRSHVHHASRTQTCSRFLQLSAFLIKMFNSSSLEGHTVEETSHRMVRFVFRHQNPSITNDLHDLPQWFHVFATFLINIYIYIYTYIR